MEEIVSGEFTTFEHRATGVAYLTFGFLGICLNLVTLLIFWCQRPLSGNKNILHIHLALANIMIVLGCPFSGLSAFNGKWLFGDFGCKAYGMETYTGGMGAVTFATFLCVERYFATACKESYNAMSSGAMTLFALLGWVIAFAIAVGPVIGWNRLAGDHLFGKLLFTWLSLVMSMMVSFVLSFFPRDVLDEILNLIGYVIEASGTACGLDWRDSDTSFFKMLLWVNSLFAIIAVFAMWAAFSHDDPTTEASKKEEEWFTDKSLNWIAVVNFAIVSIGFSPYGFFALWTVSKSGHSMTMLASIIPPLAAKVSTIFYPIAYLVASKRFRNVYASKTIGTSVDKKVQ